VINAIESFLYIAKNAVWMLGKQAVGMGDIYNWLRIMSSGGLWYAVLNLLIQLQRLSLAPHHINCRDCSVTAVVYIYKELVV